MHAFREFEFTVRRVKIFKPNLSQTKLSGMLCNQGIRKSKVPKGIEKSVESGNSPTSQSEYSNRKNFVALEIDQNSNEFPEFPWELAYAVINSTTLQGFW